jgi:hypothetical protein
MLYRIYTQDCLRHGEGVKKAMKAAGIDGFTILRGLGYWKGEEEFSMVVEVIGPERPTKGKVKRAAELIKTWNNQKEVLVTEQSLNFV